MPRFASPVGSRPQYYDRNPVMISLDGGTGDIAPHADTSRVSYTVPANKKAFLEFLQAEIQATTAPGTPSFRSTRHKYTPSGGSTVNIILKQLTANDTAAGARIGGEVGGSAIMLAADFLDMTSEDLSTTGTARYILSAKLTEFDA